MPAANPSEPPGTASQASARAIASSDKSPAASVTQTPSLSLQQHDLGDADAGSDLARQRQIERLARPAARQAIERGKRQRPPRRKGLIGSARQHHDRRLVHATDGRGAAGLQGDAMGENLATHAQCRYRGVGAADAGAADAQKQVARSIIDNSGNRCGIAPGGHDRYDFGSRRSCTLER